MGLDVGREGISSGSVSFCVDRKPSEPKCFSFSKHKHFSNNAAYVKNYSLSPIEVQTKAKMPVSSFKPLGNENGPISKYGKSGKDFVDLMVVKEPPMGSKRNEFLNVRNQGNLDLGSVKATKSCLKSSRVSDNSLHSLPFTSPLDSRKGVKHLRSVSFSDQSPNSVIRKQERGSNVRSTGKASSWKSSSPECNKIFLNETLKDSDMGFPASKSRSLLSFGNIYRKPKNLVFERDHCYKKHAQANDSVARVQGMELECGVSKPSPSNTHVLGFGKGNYGHGSVVKGVKNVDVFTKGRQEKRSYTLPSTTPHFSSVEDLKNAGNEEYKKGRFTEAISLYNKAIALCPRNAVCHNNKAAALAGLGRYTEAVGECLEAINYDHSYSRAHYRLGNLYTRLGHVEDAKWHFKLSGKDLGSKAIENLLHLEAHLMNIKKARKVKDWVRILTESTLAIEAGADASDHVVAGKAEALLNLHRAEEALELLIAARKSEENRWTKAHKGDSCLLIIETQVCMYLGRFDDAVIAAELAVNWNQSPESFMWLRKSRAVADARRAGNEFFKSGKYIEACMAYTRGLEFSPTNSVLLCNRAACRTKLGQWKMAVDDCTAALRNRSDYIKALLRRAHSNAQLEQWEESMRDYTLLSLNMPENVTIANSLLQVQTEFKKVQQGRAYNLHAGGYVAHVHCNHRFIRTVKS